MFWQPRRIVTLTTDFGTVDGYVGAMKARLASDAPGVRIVDITHDIPAQGILAAAFALRRAIPGFPAESIHVAVVDPGVGTERRPLLLRWRNQWLIGPDNGIFSELLRQEAPTLQYTLHRETRWWRASNVFDGLHLFAPAAARLARRTALDRLGTPSDRPTLFALPEPEADTVDGADVLRGVIVHFDRFGNAVTNIPAADVRSVDRIECSEVSWRLAGCYAEADGECAAIPNSDGLVELTVGNGNARDRCELTTGAAVLLYRGAQEPT